MSKVKKLLDDVLFYNMRTVIEDDGNLVPIESNFDTPFPIKRIFYVYGVRDTDVRGNHSHYKTKQLLICLNGQIEVTCKDGIGERKFLLESPQQALYIPPMVWDEQKYLSKDSVLLVLANTKYEPNDYIHDYDLFLKERNIK